MVTAERVIRCTWCERSSSYKVVCEPLGAHSAHLAHGVSRVSCVSNLDIYRSSMSPLWEHRAQNLVMCGIDLVLLLLLLTFRDTLLLYLLVLERVIRCTWCERSSSYKVICEPLSAHSAYLAYGVSRVSCVSNLGIYRSLMSSLWEYCA